MKHTWSSDYIWDKVGGGYKVSQWRQAKCQEFEAKTGVPWTHSHSRGKYVFRPHLVVKDTEAVSDPDAIKAFLLASLNSQIPGGMCDFISISEASSIALPTIMGVAKYLVMNQSAHLDVDRMGKATFITIHRKDVARLLGAVAPPGAAVWAVYFWGRKGFESLIGIVIAPINAFTWLSPRTCIGCDRLD